MHFTDITYSSMIMSVEYLTAVSSTHSMADKYYRVDFY